MTVEETRTKFAQAHVELYEGIELWRVSIADLIEQSINARSQPSDMFLQLTDTIKRGARLESTPL